VAFVYTTLLYFINFLQECFRVSKEINHIDSEPAEGKPGNKVKFEVYGEEMIEKDVKMSGNSGRVYLPPDWVGHRIKIIRVD
jgi:putative transposon-encoded protein